MKLPTVYLKFKCGHWKRVWAEWNQKVTNLLRFADTHNCLTCDFPDGGGTGLVAQGRRAVDTSIGSKRSPE